MTIRLLYIRNRTSSGVHHKMVHAKKIVDTQPVFLIGCLQSIRCTTIAYNAQQMPTFRKTHAQSIDFVFTERQRLLAAVLVFIGAICFAAKAVMVKLAYRYEVDVISLLALRMLFSLPFFTVIAWQAERRAALRGQPPLPLHDFLKIGGLGLLGYYFASWFDFMGLQYISAGLERLILFIYPTLVVLLSFLLWKKRNSRTQVIALALTYAGIAVAFLEHLLQSANTNFWLGTLYVFISALVFAVYLIGSSKVIPRIGTWRFTPLAMIAATVAILIHHAFSQQWQLFHFEYEVYVLTLLMAIFATVLPAFLVVEGLRVIGPGNTSIISSVSPVATIVLANIFLDEQFSYLQWIGTALVIGGVLLTSLQRQAANN